MKLRCTFHTPSPQMSSDRMKPRLGDWVITGGFLQKATITSLSSGSNVKCRNITRRMCSNDTILFGCKVTPHEFCNLCNDKDGCNGSDTFRISVVPVWLVLVLATI
ncbi:unnamed protein product [Timema podura]|uniref:Uncharacterized protein n=1 Tax=Timema podura TaxID=61482 RepID=A0ABN7NSI2_TIMPD|nr:unnamed protein product [Timema podura]